MFSTEPPPGGTKKPGGGWPLPLEWDSDGMKLSEPWSKTADRVLPWENSGDPPKFEDWMGMEDLTGETPPM